MRGSAALRTGVAPGGALAGPWVQNPLWTAARAVPSLDLRFADNKSLTDAVTGASLVTFTRASNGTYTDSAGVLQTAATDVPRFDHNPQTGESLGLLVEEARTNSIRNNTMVGAVAGTPGTLPTNWVGASAGNGLSREIIATGIEDGITYIDLKYSGTTTVAGVINVIPDDGVAASSGQAWTSSLYVALAAGTTNNVTVTHRIRSAVSGGGFLAATDQVLSLTSGSLKDKRTEVTLSSAAATIASLGQYIFFSYASGVAIDITFRIGLPQLEQGAFATSPILTSTTAATRSADLASITGSNFSCWYRQDEGTVFIDGVLRGILSQNYVVSISAGLSGANAHLVFGVSGALRYSVAVSSDIQANIALGSASVDDQQFIAASYQQNNFAAARNGVLGPSDTLGNLPTVDTLKIGTNSSSSAAFSGHIRRLTYWPTSFGGGVLQRVTQ